jgi:hypothetical protein
LEKVGKEEWKVLYEQGKPFRLLGDRLLLQVGIWASDEMEAWVTRGLLGQRIILALDFLSVTSPNNLVYLLFLTFQGGGRLFNTASILGSLRFEKVYSCTILRLFLFM